VGARQRFRAFSSSERLEACRRLRLSELYRISGGVAERDEHKNCGCCYLFPNRTNI